MKIKFLLLITLSILFTACSNFTTTSLNEQCFEKPQSGKCRAYIPKYYFSVEDNVCKEFIWGGCGGNIPFKTLEACKSTCER